MSVLFYLSWMLVLVVLVLPKVNKYTNLRLFQVMTVTATNPEVKIILDSLGYSSLYPPQELALSKGLLENRNLLITTPTASGKSTDCSNGRNKAN